MEKIHKNMHVALHVNFPFSAYFYPPYIIMAKGLLLLIFSGQVTYSSSAAL